MLAGQPNVLVVESQLLDVAYLEERFGRWKCHCKLATSIQQATRLLAGQTFDLIRTSIRFTDGSAYGLIPQVLGKSTTMFAFQAVEDGCWWLPVVEQGHQCLIAALHPVEFVRYLESFLGPLMPEPIQPPSAIGSFWELPSDTRFVLQGIYGAQNCGGARNI
jgi:CheY-like chemotaxis protein